MRELRSAELANGWALRWRSHLKATLDAITFASPATNGREGAGYGGVFWRFAPEIARVFSPAGDTERDVHGAATPWIAFTFPERGTSVVLVQGETLLPWFVRFAEYLGAGPAIAWDEPHTIPEGGELNLELTAFVLDEELADAAAVERALPGAAGAKPSCERRRCGSASRASTATVAPTWMPRSPLAGDVELVAVADPRGGGDVPAHDARSSRTPPRCSTPAGSTSSSSARPSRRTPT